MRNSPSRKSTASFPHRITPFTSVSTKNRRSDFELQVAFDSTGKVVPGGISVLYKPTLGEKTEVRFGNR
jgi:hypothetical protein